jgi:hypothetical protein
MRFQYDSNAVGANEGFYEYGKVGRDSTFDEG